nr:hypothetical protein Iba_chr12bCG6770 [Ipomoea batatas]
MFASGDFDGGVYTLRRLGFAAAGGGRRFRVEPREQGGRRKKNGRHGICTAISDNGLWLILVSLASFLLTGAWSERGSIVSFRMIGKPLLQCNIFLTICFAFGTVSNWDFVNRYAPTNKKGDLCLPEAGGRYEHGLRFRDCSLSCTSSSNTTSHQNVHSRPRGSLTVASATVGMVQVMFQLTFDFGNGSLADLVGGDRVCSWYEGGKFVGEGTVFAGSDNVEVSGVFVSGHLPALCARLVDRFRYVVLLRFGHVDEWDWKVHCYVVEWAMMFVIGNCYWFYVVAGVYLSLFIMGFLWGFIVSGFFPMGGDMGVLEFGELNRCLELSGDGTWAPPKEPSRCVCGMIGRKEGGISKWPGGQSKEMMPTELSWLLPGSSLTSGTVNGDEEDSRRRPLSQAPPLSRGVVHGAWSSLAGSWVAGVPWASLFGGRLPTAPAAAAARGGWVPRVLGAASDASLSCLPSDPCLGASLGSPSNAAYMH